MGTTPGVGFCEYDIPATDQTVEYDKYNKYINMEADPINTTASEGVYTTQFAIDPYTHYVYFGFRASSGEKNYATGLMYYDPTTKTVNKYMDNTDKILGICINPRKTALF